MGRTITSVLKLPEYTKALPNNAALNAKDITKILGISRRALDQRIQAGTFPQPDLDSREMVGAVNERFKTRNFVIKKFHWKLSTLRQFEKTQNDQ